MKQILMTLIITIMAGNVFAAAASEGGDDPDKRNGKPHNRVPGYSGKKLTPEDRSYAVRAASLISEPDSENESEESDAGSSQPSSNYAPPSQPSSQESDGSAATAPTLPYGGSQETATLSSADAETLTAGTDEG